MNLQFDNPWHIGKADEWVFGPDAIQDNIYRCLPQVNLHGMDEGLTSKLNLIILLDIDGNKVPITRNAYDPSNANVLYRLLHPTMIAKVGNYYYCLRQRPGKKGNQFEYIPNRKYSYREVKRTLAQIKISVLPSRMWDEAPLTALTDKMLHPYTEYCPSVCDP